MLLYILFHVNVFYRFPSFVVIMYSPSGCRPKVGGDVTDSETHKETLIREAMEFIEIYYNDRQDEMKYSNGFLSKEERMVKIKKSIEETGSYEHTFDELEHGARVAWRNAPKCSNRKYWEQLKLLDCRGVETNEGIFKSCLDHISKAMVSVDKHSLIDNVCWYSDVIFLAQIV